MSSVSEKHSTKRHPTKTAGVYYRLREDGSRSYVIGYQDGPKWKWETVAGDYEDAKAERGRRLDKLSSGERVARWGKRKVADAGAEYLADAESGLKRGNEHRRQFVKEIVPAWGNRKLGSITPHDVITLDKKLRARGLSEATVANYLKPARGMFEFAVLNGGLGVSPFALVPRGRLSSCNKTREHREWTTAEVQRLIAKRYELDKRPESRSEYGLSVEMKVRTGARLGELLGGRYGDIDFEQGVWHINGQYTKDGRFVDYAKTAKGIRRVPLAPELVKKIAARKLRRGEGDGGYIHTTRAGGRPMPHTSFRRRGWHPAVRATGLTDGPKVTPHDARHAFASEMAYLGLSSEDVGDVLGHTSKSITEAIYTHAFNRDKREQRIREAMKEAMGNA
jgi:integrase